MIGYGLTTFANLPYVFCLSDKGNEDVERFDVAFLGAGFDTVSSLFFVFREGERVEVKDLVKRGRHGG